MEFRTFAAVCLLISKLASDHVRDCSRGKRRTRCLLDRFECLRGNLGRQLRLDLLYFRHYPFMQYVLVAVYLGEFDGLTIHVFIET